VIKINRLGPYTASYIVYKGSDGKTYVKDGITGAIDLVATSDYQAIQYAIDRAYQNGGGRIYIREGVYNITNSITIPEGDVNLVIEGSGSDTVLTPASDIDVFIAKVANKQFIRYLTIRNLRISGNINSPYGRGLVLDVTEPNNQLQYLAFVNVENVEFYGLKQAIYMKNVWLSWFTRIKAQYSGASPYSVISINKGATDSTHDVYFTELYIEPVYYRPVEIGDTCYDIIFDKAYIYGGNADYAIYMTDWGGEHVVIKNSYIIGSTKYAVRLGITSVVENTIIRDVGGGGVEIANIGSRVINSRIGANNGPGIWIRQPYAIVEDNYIYGGTRGIFVDWLSNYSIIRGNAIRNSQQEGIWIYHSDYVTVANNSVTDPSQSGTYAGIRITEEGHNKVIGNTVTGANMNYAISEENTDYNIIAENVVNKPINKTGANTILANNITS